MPEQVIGHYRIIEKIGSGSMGEVYRAHDDRLGRDVALKLIRPSSSSNPDHVRRFEIEARAAAALNHPNIVAVYDVGTHEGSPYIVCELLEGKTLRTALAGGPLPVRQAVDYAQQIVQGLMAAHSHRIVHRDLKPENLFVTTDGRIKILDFGVAKLQPSPEDSSRSVQEMTTVTRSGTVIGTVAYMSPEQLRSKAVDHRSDIFSVGAILYEMLTARRAFHGETEVDTITAVLREEPAEINLEESRVPRPCQEIVRHCLEKEPENRFQSARDLAFALTTLASTDGPTFRFKARRSARVLPWVVAGVLLMVTAILLARPLLRNTTSPSYQRLTFEQGTIYSARFTPDFHGIVYTAAWNGKPEQLFSSVGDSHFTQPVSLADADLLAVSRTGELAVTLHGSRHALRETEGGTLARAPLAGGSPREVLENVSWAEWDTNGDLAVVHHAEGRDQIEYPIGRVLYRGNGWIGSIRFSPAGDKIAFMDHPALWDDRGSIRMVDLSGHLQVLSSDFDTEDGLAWSPDGKEIWFAASQKGSSARALFAVNSNGRTRKLLDLPVSMTLEDVAPDGRALVSLDNERLAMETATRDGKPIDLSWRDWTVVKGISPDGQSILFEDDSEAAGTHYTTGIRNIDGTPPVQLAEGSAGSLSPDGKWAISIIPGKPGEMKLVPIGPGQPRSIAIPGLEQIFNGAAKFLADGKHIVINGIEPGHAVRSYMVDLDGGAPVPVTPEGIAEGLVSPDGKKVVRADAAGMLGTYPIGGGEPQPIPGLKRPFRPFLWSEDGSFVYGYDIGRVPTGVYKVDLVSGAKTLVQNLQPGTAAGVVNIAPIVMTRDASRFAYSYYQVLSTLYIISGLH